jgi:hypothetical protein
MANVMNLQKEKWNGTLKTLKTFKSLDTPKWNGRLETLKWNEMEKREAEMGSLPVI